MTMNFKKMQNIIILLGIIITAVDGKGNNWSEQGGNRWQNSDNLSSQSGIQGNIAQNQDGSGNGKAGKANYGQGGRGFTSRDMQVKNEGSFNNMRNSQNAGSWGPQDTQVKDTVKIGRGIQQDSTSQGWTAGDSQAKDTDNKNYGNNNQDTRRMWNPEDAQVKDGGAWSSGGNQQANRNNWGPQDSQIKDGLGNQRNRNNWGPSQDTQVKDSGRWNAGPNQGNFDPSDAQVKDSGRNAGGNYPSSGNFGPNDAQVKNPNKWNDGGNQQSSGPFRPGDAQEKTPGSWMGDRNQRMPDGWNPGDGQVKDTEGWNRDESNQGSGPRWGPGEGQMKINEGWDQDGKKELPQGMWGQDQGPIEGGPSGGNWQPDQGPGPVQGGEWPSGQDGISKPPVDQGPMINGNQGIDGNQGGVQPGDVGIPEDGYGPGGNREMGDTGVIPDTFPPRVPQGNYKGGDTPHPGDDSSQWRLEDSIPGSPGVDYPNYSTIPETGFDCKQHPDPGYYGDVEAQCQVFHICQADGRHDSFLCPLGTIFNQQYFVCVWWFNYDCADTTMYYNLNADLYKGGHGAQGNFKGTPVGTTGPKEGSDSYSTPPVVATGNIGDTGRSDYGSGPAGGQVESIVPPGVGVQNVGQSGMIGPILPTVTGMQPGNYGPNQGPGAVSGEQAGYGPTTEQPINVPEGVWNGVEGQKPQDNTGRRPDTPVIGGQDTGYGTVGDNRGQDGGKRNWGNQSGQRNWGIKGGSANGNQGGRWGSGEDTSRNNWENGNGYDGGKKGGNWVPNGGSVKGRKARSWGSGEIYDSGVDKRWGSEESDIPFDGQQGSWMSLDEVPPPAPFANQETHARDEVYEEEKTQNGNWNADSVEQGQRGFMSDPQQFSRIPDWDDKEKDVGSSEHNRNWSNEERNNDLETIGDRPIDQGRKWRTIDDSRERINNREDERPQTINKNWWKDALGRNVEDNKENWNEGESEPSLRLNNVQDTKDTPHIYGNWRNVNSYYDHDKDYNPENNSERQNWTK